jgi:hypothetical protein
MMRSGFGTRIPRVATSPGRLVQDVGHEALKLRRHEGLRDEGDAPGAAEFVRLLGWCRGEGYHRNATVVESAFRCSSTAKPDIPGIL